MTPPNKSTNSQEIVLRTQPILEILHKWGIHTLGEFASLDKDEVCARLGPEGVFLWERGCQRELVPVAFGAPSRNLMSVNLGRVEKRHHRAHPTMSDTALRILGR
jgi:hypothetical protein